MLLELLGLLELGLRENLLSWTWFEAYNHEFQQEIQAH
jgi:hypothetical protein